MNLAEINRKIKDVQKELGEHQLSEINARSDPFEQFITWFSEILQSNRNTPSAMILATTDEKGYPDARVVLLKELAPHRFMFYSNYLSRKAKQLEKNNVAVLNFYWSDFVRQVRIKGRIEKLSREQSEAYFQTRPRDTQLGAHVCIQSSVIASRTEIEDKLKIVTEKFANQTIPCPDYWGGYALIPFEYEFFQGRLWRMHDRLLYTLENQLWVRKRLAP